MKRHLALLLLVALTSCVPTAHQKSAHTSPLDRQPAAPDFTAIEYIGQPQIPTDLTTTPLTDLPRTEEGGFVLSPGFYETDFKTYCLQPGTPGPSTRDVYYQGVLGGPRKDIIQAILLNSQTERQLEQRNVQLLLWSVVSRSDFQKLSPQVQSAARQLLSPKQVFELQGGVMGLVKTVASNLPYSEGNNDIRKLFELSVNSYEAYERLAVVNTPSDIRRPDMTRDQWYQQPEGYFVRYLPYNYKQAKIQVYVPATIADSASHAAGNYVIFDPASRVVVPANSNAQRLGIGGPVTEIIKAVIKGAGKTRPAPPIKKPTPQVVVK